MNRNLLQLIMFRAYTSVKAEMSRNYLGFIWWLIEPILYMGAFYMLFGMGLRTGGPGFIEFLLVGITAWKWFGACLAASTFVVSANKSLIDNSAVNKIIFPLSMILANTFKHMFIVVLLLTFLVFSGNTVFVTWWYLPLVLAVQLILTVGLCCLIAAVIPFVPDLAILINNMMILLFFLSGVFFNINSIQNEVVKFILNLNPALHLIQAHRAVLLNGVAPDLYALGFISIASVVMFSISLLIFSRKNGIYAKIL